ncbi:MAG: 5'/3'-nucleotidase SurE [Chloroflexi bacterium]|nr:MAG: 5'/3'-nucleotidase SurE [Chloroflexota bacterium]
MAYIMVTNDDGYDSPGILALAQAMRELGEVQVVAPAKNQSAVGHKKTLFQDIEVHEKEMADGTKAVTVSASPADCIAMAAMGITKWPPNVVVSGVNRGANMGQDITYSGTVTAALEATIQGIPAVAVSQRVREYDPNDSVDDYRTAAAIAVKVVKKVMRKGLPPFTILNLNVPYGDVKGLRLTRQGVRIYNDELEVKGNIYRIVGPEPGGLIDEEGTDLWAVHNGYASLTPIHLDLTAHQFFAELAAWDLQAAHSEA